MKVAIMQPYIFPYIGYFQLIQEVDVFVFYDDVNFIKKGFINRNSLLFNNAKHRFTIPCKAVSQNKKINTIQIDRDSDAIDKLLVSISTYYAKAPFFDTVFPMVKACFDDREAYNSIADMAIKSVLLVAEYLQLPTKFLVSSAEFKDTEHLNKEERLIRICKRLQAEHYINPIGGEGLYSKTQFETKGIELSFLKTNAISYSQFGSEFVPWLSIIDVLMFNSKDKVSNFLKSYTLV